MQDQTNIGIDESNLWMILATYHEGQVAGTVQQLQAGRYLADFSCCHIVFRCFTSKCLASTESPPPSIYYEMN